MAPATPSTTSHGPWQEVAQRKVKDRERMLSKYAQWRPNTDMITAATDVTSMYRMELSARELSIVECDATELLERIHRGDLKCVEVIQAYIHAATIAQVLTNCLTEVFFDEAIARAQELDAHMAKTGQPVGPLHGLPVSIKDHIMVEGKDTSTGYIAWCYKRIAPNDAVAVAILRKAGALLYVKTNNPQTLLSLETDNNIYGRTSNPMNRDLTSGGSSGGESALIAMHGSPLGLGTDIGGSIRLPAACTGLYGLKASVGRIPHAGLCGSHDGMDAIVGVLGPIARSARDLALFCKVMLDYQPWTDEPPLLEIPWRPDVVNGSGLPKDLSFAVLWDDGVVAPHRPITEALAKVTDCLIAAGHNVIRWEPLRHAYAWDLITKLYFLDGGQEYHSVLAESGEPAVPQTEWIMSFAPNEGKPFTVQEGFRLNREREDFRKELMDHWNQTIRNSGTGRPVEAIICPVAPTLAPAHNSTRWWGYTSYWNLADYPAVVFPANKFSKNELYNTVTPTNNLHRCNGSSNGTRGGMEKFIQNQWNEDLYDGFPVCLQLVGRRLNEEKLLAMLNVVEAALK